HLGFLLGCAQHFEARRFRPPEHVGIAEEQHREEQREEAAHRDAAPFAAIGQTDEGEDAERQGEEDEGDEEGGHCVTDFAFQALRNSLWTRLTLPGTTAPLSSLKRKIVVAWPTKVMSTVDCRIARTAPSWPCTEILAVTGTGKRPSAER